MENTTLVIMAAGIGSRVGGGIKQLTSFGPGGEIIMDYSIYDAIEAGFNKVVFVTRKDMYQDFQEIIGERISKVIPVEYAFQEMNDLPAGFTVPEGRVKPWGTGQAILACRGIVNEPFAVINADDYYGKDAFRKVHDYLLAPKQADDNRYHFCMAGFILKNTLSENGGVTRGICHVNERKELLSIEETHGILKKGNGAFVPDENGTLRPLDVESLVSMNFWGFSPLYLRELERQFPAFLDENLPRNPLKCEYFVPSIVDAQLRAGTADVTMLHTDDAWHGVTYHDDLPDVVAALRALRDAGKYPDNIW